MMPPLLRWSAGIAAGVGLTLAAQLALGQGVAGGFRQTTETPIQRLNAAVQQLGIRNCAPVFNQAGAFLFEDAAAQFGAAVNSCHRNRTFWRKPFSYNPRSPPGRTKMVMPTV